MVGILAPGVSPSSPMVCTEPGFPHHDLVQGSISKTVHYLGFLPKDTPKGSSKLGYSLRA